MPFLVHPRRAPFIHMRQHGIVNATPGNIAQALKCLLVDQFEATLSSQLGRDVEIIDRYNIGGGIRIPAILEAPIDDSYKLEKKGITFTVLPNAAILDTDDEDNFYQINKRWRVLIKDYSEVSILMRVIDHVRRQLFKDSVYIPDYDLEETDNFPASGSLYIDLSDNPRATANLAVKENIYD